ncbi:MAG: hypothetical protein AMXMBFR8_02100 [Nevskiales bacterium]
MPSNSPTRTLTLPGGRTSPESGPANGWRDAGRLSSDSHQKAGKPWTATGGHTAGMDSRPADAWRLACNLLEAADALEADPVTVALAHAGAAVVLFSRFDPATAERIAAAIEQRPTY